MPEIDTSGFGRLPEKLLDVMASISMSHIEYARLEAAIQEALDEAQHTGYSRAVEDASHD